MDLINCPLKKYVKSSAQPGLEATMESKVHRIYRKRLREWYNRIKKGWADCRHAAQFINEICAQIEMRILFDDRVLQNILELFLAEQFWFYSRDRINQNRQILLQMCEGLFEQQFIDLRALEALRQCADTCINELIPSFLRNTLFRSSLDTNSLFFQMLGIKMETFFSFVAAQKIVDQLANKLFYVYQDTPDYKDSRQADFIKYMTKVSTKIVQEPVSIPPRSVPIRNDVAQIREQRAEQLFQPIQSAPIVPSDAVPHEQQEIKFFFDRSLPRPAKPIPIQPQSTVIVRSASPLAQMRASDEREAEMQAVEDEEEIPEWVLKDLTGPTKDIGMELASPFKPDFLTDISEKQLSDFFDKRSVDILLGRHSWNSPYVPSREANLPSQQNFLRSIPSSMRFRPPTTGRLKAIAISNSLQFSAQGELILEAVQRQMNSLKSYLQHNLGVSGVVGFNVYGSYSTHLALRQDFDIDLNIITSPTTINPREVLSILDTLIRRHENHPKGFSNAMIGPTSRNPLVKIQYWKFNENNGPIESVDCLVNAPSGVLNSAFIRQYGDNMYIMEMLLLVKMWAKIKGIINHEQPTNGMSSFGIVLMVLYFLMRTKQIPFARQDTYGSCKAGQLPEYREFPGLDKNFRNFLQFYRRDGQFQLQNQTLCVLKDCTDNTHWNPNFIINMHDPMSVSTPNPGRMKKTLESKLYGQIEIALCAMQGQTDFQELFNMKILTDMKKEKRKRQKARFELSKNSRRLFQGLFDIHH